MEEYIAQILIQLPLVALFVWYNERRDERSRKERLERDAEWRKWMDKQEDHRIAVRDLLHEQMAGEMDRLSEAIEKLDGSLDNIAGGTQ